MSDPIRVMVELGPRKKKAVALAFDWPGWDRAAKSDEEALRVLEAYRPRYAKVADISPVVPTSSARPGRCRSSSASRARA